MWIMGAQAKSSSFEKSRVLRAAGFGKVLQDELFACAPIFHIGYMGCATAERFEAKCACACEEIEHARTRGLAVMGEDIEEAFAYAI